MPFAKARITRSRFVYSPFSSEQTMQLGTFMAGVKKERIQKGLNSQDSSARPLVEKYARRKITRGRAPIRDWTFTGLTLAALQPLRANENAVTIGFADVRADLRAAVQERREKQFEISPSDRQALHAYVLAMIKTQSSFKIRRTAAA